MIDFWSDMGSMIGVWQGSLNSVGLASFIPQTFLANSMVASCIPKHKPKNGIFFTLAYSIALIMPSTPLLPNPPGTMIPFVFLNILDKSVSFSNASESIQLILIFG